MADQGLWFKLWCSAPSDPHISNLSLEDFARWCLFGVYMKVHGNNGILVIQKPARALQNAMQCDTYEMVLLTLQKFPNCDMREEGKRATDGVVALTIEWKNWSKYQGDYSTIRSARWRDRQRFKRRGEEKRREEKRSVVFVPPTEIQVLEFAKSEGFGIDARKFCNFYASKGWLVGKVSMKDWRAAARNWKTEGPSVGGIPQWMQANKTT